METAVEVPQRDFLLSPGRGRPLHAILMEVCEEYQFSLAELINPCRYRPYVYARQEAMWRCRKETPASLPEIGRMFKRDIATVIHGIRAHETRLLKGHMALLPNTNSSTSEREIGT